MSSADVGSGGIDGGSIVVDVKARLAEFDREMARARREASDAESRRGAWASRTATAQAGIREQINDLRRLQRAERDLTQEVARREAAQVSAARASLRSVGRASAVGLGLWLGAQNLQSVSSDPGAVSSRAGGFLSNALSLNLVGAVKAAQATAAPTREQIQGLGTDASVTLTEIQRMAAGLRAIGQSGAAEALTRIRGEMIATQAAANALAVTAVDSMDNKPRGPGGIAAEVSGVDTFRKPGLLNKFLQQQTALAATTPGLADDIAQAKKNIAYLNRLKQDTRIVGDARTGLYTQISSEQDRLAALQREAKGPTKTPKEPPILPAGLELQIAQAEATLDRTDDDLAALKRAEQYLVKRIAAEKDVDRRVQEWQRLGQIRAQIAGLADTGTTATTTAANVLGALGQGGYLSSARFQFAESFGYQARPRDYVRDAQQQLRTDRQFLRNINRLGKLGASKGLIGELVALGPGQGGDLAAGIVAGGRQTVGTFNQVAAQRASLARQTVALQEMYVQATQITITAASVNVAARTGNPGVWGSASNPNDRFALTGGR